MAMGRLEFIPEQESLFCITDKKMSHTERGREYSGWKANEVSEA